MARITRVEILGLNGNFNANIELRGKHCILVGPNGIGKSTALQIISYALGRQWKLLSKQRFKSIRLHFGERSLEISRQAAAGMAVSKFRRSSVVSNYERLKVRDLLQDFLMSDLKRRDVREKYRFISPDYDELSAMQFQLQEMEGFTDLSRSEGRLFEKGLIDLESPRVIFLPTSRRIELELDRIIENVPEYVKSGLVEALRKSSSSSYFEEIVRFGMDDIQAIITQFEQQARDESRDRFNRMMSTFLKEMANGEAIPVKALRDHDVSQTGVDSVLARIEEGILTSDEKQKISETLTSLSTPGTGTPSFHKKWLAHFFLRLLSVDSEMKRTEEPVSNLVKRIEKYLFPKIVKYDIERYHFSITSGSGDELGLGDLSSGEKQLISILTMLEFSPTLVSVFIDEPELSLSVPWQETFLVDLVASSKCHQLFAVTHSPFIFDNELRSSTIDFQSCLENKRD